jgi:polyferredoxin
MTTAGKAGGRTTSRTKDVSLPVRPGSLVAKRVQRGRIGRLRFTVLTIVQVLLVLHVVLWLINGSTLKPIEPSEAKDFGQQGVINVGFIFFAIALLSTLLLGRWFCGWGCHVLLLQDGCGWVMRKLGIRPTAFRSRLLIYVPFLLALYLFIWPAVFWWGLVPLDKSLEQRLGSDHAVVSTTRAAFGFLGVPLAQAQPRPLDVQWQLTTERFWDTFPGWAIGVPFLLICGFGTVYFLGNKGYCTYGCPYGGFFAPLDEFAPARIVVSDACQGCGHCTAVCTSNVRVHEEVRDYGMVIDPGCMKTLDCVHACPNEALSFKFARPAAFVSKHQKAQAKAKRKVKHSHALSLGQELFVAAVFIISFCGSYSVYGPGRFPLLMASGIAGCVTFIIWKATRLLLESNVRFHKFQLRRNGRIRVGGWAMLLLAMLCGALVVHGCVIRGAFIIGHRHNTKVVVPIQEVIARNPITLDDEMAHHARRAIAMFDFVSPLTEQGIGLSRHQEIDRRRFLLHACLHEYEPALENLDRLIAMYKREDPERVYMVLEDLNRQRVILENLLQMQREGIEEVFPESFDPVRP